MKIDFINVRFSIVTGVQIAYFAIIGTQMFMIVLSIFLFYGIYKVSKHIFYFIQVYKLGYNQVQLQYHLQLFCSKL